MCSFNGALEIEAILWREGGGGGGGRSLSCENIIDPLKIIFSTGSGNISYYLHYAHVWNMDMINHITVHGGLVHHQHAMCT